MRKLFAVFGLLLLFLPAVRAAEDAQALFNAKCSTCHGVKGDGKGHEGMKIKPADLRSAAVQKLSDEELFKTIAYGVGHKEYAHGFIERGLNAEQISGLVTYLRKFARPAKRP
jgi:mono/diheme cytochrome c family protein